MRVDIVDFKLFTRVNRLRLWTFWHVVLDIDDGKWFSEGEHVVQVVGFGQCAWFVTFQAVILEL